MEPSELDETSLAEQAAAWRLGAVRGNACASGTAHALEVEFAQAHRTVCASAFVARYATLGIARGSTSAVVAVAVRSALRELTLR